MAEEVTTCEQCEAARTRLLAILRRHGIRNAGVLRSIAVYARCPRHRTGTNIIVLDDDDPS